MSSLAHAVRTITCRDDLSFTCRTADERQILINWMPVRVSPQPNQWNLEYRLGEAMADEVRTLHAADEEAAFEAIQFAITSQTWSTRGYGAESGFAAAVAALAVVGMRALQAGAAPFVSEGIIED